ncbi:MAG: hypothetical protein LH629_07425, partial [Ignavibacteria bacterium]|nr:hypothetical protein [Ignavibacteria bacterium]
ECLTLAHYEITKNKIPAGTSGEAMIEFPDLNIKPGEYPLYFEIRDNGMNANSKDVIDDLTAPLVIKNGDRQKHPDFIPGIPSGFFVTPSRLILNEIRMDSVIEKLLA